MPDPVGHDPQSLFTPVDVPQGAGLVTIFTSPTGAGTRGTRLSGIHVCNHTGLAVTFRLTHTQSGGVAAANKALVWDISIPADGTEHVFAVGIILDPGDFLSHEAGTAAALSIHGFGWNMS